MAAATVSRAITKRYRPEASTPMQRSEPQHKFPSGTIKRSKISLPIDLISTTNMLAYTAPDLPGRGNTIRKVPSSSASSSRSGGDDSEHSTRGGSSTAATSPDTMSPESSPISTAFHRPFGANNVRKRSNTSGTIDSSAGSSQSRDRSSTSSSSSAPAIPRRSLSHTKKSHQELSRQRSLSKISPPTSLSTTHASRLNQQDPLVRKPQDVDSHPFGKELEQVNEVAEEFGGYIAETEEAEEERSLRSKGFKKFSAEDYLSEIEGLYQSIFGADLRPSAAQQWI